MIINLYKLLGVKKGEVFRIKNSNHIYKIINNEIYFKSKNINWTKSYISLNEIKEIIKLQKKPSSKIRDFIKILKPKWKYIAMDKDGQVFLYTAKPIKDKARGMWDTDINDDIIDNDNIIIDDLIEDKFDFLSWKDEEPFDITPYR